MKVVFFHRKPRPNVNFSVENLFKQIRANLPKDVNWEVKELKYFSEGLFKRIYISLEAALSQKGINHITGDINFIAIFLKKKRTVLTMLDLGFMNRPKSFGRLVLRWFWVVLPVKRSAIVTTISEATKRELLKFVDIEPSRVKVVYVPISDSFVQNSKPFNKEKPRILQIGTSPNKNVIRLVQALRGVPCVLDIIGMVNDDLKRELKESGVTFTEAKNISNEEMLEHYRAADILSFVSTYEGFGMPIVEANAVGRVVLTSNLLSMPEVAGEAAHLVDPFDVSSIRAGILKVIEDDAYRETLITRGFANRKRFDARQIAQDYAEIYRRLSAE